MPLEYTRPLAVDLFAGAGGLSLGLEHAGYEIAAAVEYDPIHAAVHEYNFPYGKTFARDVTGITGAEIRSKSEIGDREIALVAGGPPCQGISLIGRRAIDDPRNALLKEYVRLVLELQPRHFLMENVAGLTVGKHRQLLTEVIDLLSDGGYQVLTPYRVLQAADYGTPQSRKRLILLGAREDRHRTIQNRFSHLDLFETGLSRAILCCPLGLPSMTHSQIYPMLIRSANSSMETPRPTSFTVPLQTTRQSCAA